MTGPYNPARDSNAGVGVGDDYSADLANKDLAGFNAGALGADQLPTAGHDQQPEQTSYTYPTPQPGGGLGL
jgi:hypothetical protein